MTPENNDLVIIDFESQLAPLLFCLQRAVEAASQFGIAISHLADIRFDLDNFHDKLLELKYLTNTDAQERRRVKRFIREEIAQRRLEKKYGAR